MTRFHAAAIVSLLILTSGVASAQTAGYRPERPYRGIFASGVDNSLHSLVGNATVSAGYDDDILADATGRNNRPTSGRQGVLGQLSGGLNYGLNADRASVNAGLGGTVRYYPSLAQDYFRTYSAGVSGSVRVLDKPDVSAGAGVHYQPVSFLSSFPALTDVTVIDPPEADFVPVEAQYLAYNAGLSLDQPLSRRVSVSTSAAYRATDQLETEFWSQSLNAALHVQMTREVGLRLGYTYSEGHYEGRPTTQVHRPDIGLDFARALSLTRRTTFSFGLGLDATATNRQTRFRAAGQAQVTHEIGRSWTARGAFQRGTYFVETISEPIFSDAVSASLVGLLTRRLQFSAVANASIGRAGATSQQFDSYRGSVALSMALTRYMNTGVDYAYYRYVSDPLIGLPFGYPLGMNRQSIRGHISLWVPLLNRPRSSNATR